MCIQNEFLMAASIARALDKQGGITSVGGIAEVNAKSTSHSTQTTGISLRPIPPPPATDDSVKAEDAFQYLEHMLTRGRGVVQGKKDTV